MHFSWSSCDLKNPVNRVYVLFQYSRHVPFAVYSRGRLLLRLQVRLNGIRETGEVDVEEDDCRREGVRIRGASS
jgi:hypothetical protein